MAVRENSSISTIFFDLDNTLIQTRKADKLVCNKVAEIIWEKYGIPFDVATLICTNYLRAFRKCPDNPAMELDTWRKILWVQALGSQYQVLAGEIYHKWLQLRYAHLALKPDIKLLLEKLRQTYFLGLITNGPSNAQWEKINRLNLQAYFDISLVSGDLPWEKPHQKIFYKACQYFQVQPFQCLMVGDKIETDILGGIQAKLGGTVWIPLSGASLDVNGPQPDYIIEKVQDLPSLLPKNVKVPAFRRKKGFISLPDFYDCNSNSSDGS